MKIELTKIEKSSLYCNTDVLIRKMFGMIQSPYDEADVQRIVDGLKLNYSKSEKYKELLVKLKDDEIIKFINKIIVDMLDDRCTHKQIAYYKSLCKKYGLDDKGSMNRSKLSTRIQSMLESNGEHQNSK